MVIMRCASSGLRPVAVKCSNIWLPNAGMGAVEDAMMKEARNPKPHP